MFCGSWAANLYGDRLARMPQGELESEGGVKKSVNIQSRKEIEIEREGATDENGVISLYNKYVLQQCLPFLDLAVVAGKPQTGSAHLHPHLQ